MTITVIGLCGLAGSGKSTIADYLGTRHGYYRKSFAHILKAMSAQVLDYDEMRGDLKELPLAKLGGKTPRQFMQLLGTEFGREIMGEDFWVNLWRERVTNFPHRYIVADDVRFANEAQAIRSMGGIVIRLVRDGAGSASGAGHSSEAMDFRADVTMHNNGSAEQLADDIAYIAAEPEEQREAA